MQPPPPRRANWRRCAGSRGRQTPRQQAAEAKRQSKRNKRKKLIIVFKKRDARGLLTRCSLWGAAEGRQMLHTLSATALNLSSSRRSNRISNSSSRRSSYHTIPAVALDILLALLKKLLSSALFIRIRITKPLNTIKEAAAARL